MNCLVFLHSLLMAPLLVECITPDGQNLIEILGQDPCHDRYINNLSAVPNNSHGAAVSKNCDAADRCIDLFMNNFDGLSDCSANALSPPQAPVDLDQPGGSVPVAAMPDSQDLRRPPDLPSLHIPALHLILRI
jgi:hypothetical protein